MPKPEVKRAIEEVMEIGICLSRKSGRIGGQLADERDESWEMDIVPNLLLVERLRLSQAQKPFAVVLSCSDSRLPPEVIFDQGLGDLFVIRVAGNVVDPAGLGSIEYAVGHLGTPLVMVMGHENCGAVSATLEALQPPFEQPHGAVASLITAITPAVAVAEQQQGDLLVNAIRANALQSREEIMKSHELEGPLGSGALKVVTSYYNLQDGTVSII